MRKKLKIKYKQRKYYQVNLNKMEMILLLVADQMLAHQINYLQKIGSDLKD